MSKDNRHPNWNTLSQSGATSISPIGGESIKVFNLPEEIAMNLGYAATVAIDKNSGQSTYTNIDFNNYKNLGSNGRNETRPGGRDTAVTVEGSSDRYTVTVELRNAYEDNAALTPKGVTLIQSSFIAAVESIEL